VYALAAEGILRKGVRLVHNVIALGRAISTSAYRMR
jgi:hypothetical protein